MAEEAAGVAAVVAVACPAAVAEEVFRVLPVAAAVVLAVEAGAIRGRQAVVAVEVTPGHREAVEAAILDRPEVAISRVLPQALAAVPRGLRAAAAQLLARPAEAAKHVHPAEVAQTGLRNSRQAAAGACPRTLRNGPLAAAIEDPLLAAPRNSPPAIVPLNYRAMAQTAPVPALIGPAARIVRERPTGRE